MKESKNGRMEQSKAMECESRKASSNVLKLLYLYIYIYIFFDTQNIFIYIYIYKTLN